VIEDIDELLDYCYLKLIGDIGANNCLTPA